MLHNSFLMGWGLLISRWLITIKLKDSNYDYPMTSFLKQKTKEYNTTQMFEYKP